VKLSKREDTNQVQVRGGVQTVGGCNGFFPAKYRWIAHVRLKKKKTVACEIKI
jgi:hypothetical protein